MKKIRMIVVGVLTFIIALAIGMVMLFNSDKILINFDIISVTNEDNIFTVKYENVKAADYYVLNVYDDLNRKIYETTTEENVIEFPIDHLVHDTAYSFMIYAYDENGDYRPANKEVIYKWTKPSFSVDNSIVLNNEDALIGIDGEIDGYKIKLIKNDEVISNEKLTTNEYELKSDLYKDTESVIKLIINKDKKNVSEITLYNNVNPITDINIVSPVNESVITYNDFTLNYEGGDNALNYTINIYKGKQLIRTSETTKHKVVLSKGIFMIAESYRIEVVAKYGDYSKSSEINITMSDKEKNKPVYLNKNYHHIKAGTKLELLCDSENAKIYYTTNGENPESMGLLYSEPIEIKEDMLLKAVSVSDDKYNSDVVEFNINTSEKKELKIYISPSNQTKNFGVRETGFTNECDEMNDVADYVIERLKQYPNVKIMRNNSSGNINIWNQDSNYFGADFKLAIHSNGSTDHTSQGIETWIDTENSKTYGIASLIQKNLWSIYPYNDDMKLNRGVKYANGALGEANDNYIPFGILVEIAHHDNYQDASWIMENKKLIGYNIADSILEYYQFK